MHIKNNFKKFLMTTVMVGAMVVPIFILNSTKIEALTCSNKAQCEAMKAEKEQQKALYRLTSA